VAAVERAMEKNRDARFPDVNSFVKAVTSRSLATAPTVQTAPQETAAPTERISREPSKTPVFIAFGIAVLASVGFTVWKLKPREPEEAALPSQTTTATSTPPPPSTSPPTPKPPATADTPARAEKPDEPKADAEPKKAPVKEPPRAVKSAAAKETAPALSPEAARDLDEAEAALEAGKPGEAVRLAQHSLYAQKSSRAYAVITRARCAQGDLGNAKANLSHVAPRDRSQVVRACGKLGVELH
jgi:hypothetical protein